MKKMSVRMLCVLLVLTLAVGLSACDENAKPAGKDTPSAATPVPQITPEPAAVTPTPETVTAAVVTPEPASPAAETPTPTDTPAPVTITLQYNDARATALTFQTSTVFQLQAITSDGSTGGSWTSSDASVASVDLYGVVTCYKPGTAKITYTQGEASDSCTLTITEPTVFIVYGGVEKTDITLKGEWGFEIDLQAAVTPEGTPVTWTSDDTSVATVDENGHVTAKRMGTTTVHAKCGTAVASCIVRVMENPPTYVAPTPDASDGVPRLVIVFWGVPNDDFTIKVGTSVQMNYVLYNVEGNPAVTWTIEDPGFASVDGNGIVTGIRPTKEKSAYQPYTKLIATCGNLRCETIVRVVEADSPI